MNDYLLTYQLIRRRKRKRSRAKPQDENIKEQFKKTDQGSTSLIGLSKTILHASCKDLKTNILGKSKTVIPDLSPFMVDGSLEVETEKIDDLFDDESDIDYEAEAIHLKPISLTADVTIEDMERLGETLNAINEVSEKEVLNSTKTLELLRGTELYEQVQKSEKLHLLRERFKKIGCLEETANASLLEDMSKMFENK